MTEKLLHSKAGGVITLSFNRPEIRNALDTETAQALTQRIAEAVADSSSRVIVITGVGGAFGAGADMRAGMAETGGNPLDAHRILTEAYAPAIAAIWGCPLPIIAAVDGPAVGISCDLALACDLRLFSERGVLQESFIKLGLVPDGGGTFLLPRYVGLGRALELMYFGDKLDAAAALALGLANRVYPTELFAEEVAAYAEKLATQSPQALMLGKRAMKAALRDVDLADAMAREAEFQRQILASADGFEGFLAFLEKRPPVWKWQRGQS
jgi:2-(1,2-epoxy-1,2-dihydrophenyl)acetyl-CoA isomerase